MSILAVLAFVARENTELPLEIFGVFFVQVALNVVFLPDRFRVHSGQLFGDCFAAECHQSGNVQEIGRHQQVKQLAMIIKTSK